jgi:hypothetical protein
LGSKEERSTPSQKRSPSVALPKVPGFGKIAEALSIGGVFGKLTKLLKSFLP